MRKISIALTLAFVLPACVAHSQNPPPSQPGAGSPPAANGARAGAPGAIPLPPSAAANGAVDQKQVSYALGRQFAMNLKRNDIACDLESLFAGIRDTTTGAKPQFTDEQLGATMQRFMLQMRERAEARLQQQVDKNQKLEADFFAKNKAKPGVQTTASGLQYKVLQQGQGASPTKEDIVRCNYRGVLLDGTEFDSSAAHGGPAEFPVGGVIPGWTEALQKMKVGDKWELYVPSALAYDMDPPPDSPIEPGSPLVFEIELLGIGGR